jgi:hypothetical protein
MTRRQFDHATVSKQFTYDPATGILLRNGREVTLAWWRARDHRWEAASVRFLGHRITVTHVIWMLMRHRWPVPGKVIDHINGDVFNCRWHNLREITQAESLRNREPWARPSATEDDLASGSMAAVIK